MLLVGWIGACLLILPFAKVLEDFKPTDAPLLERELRYGSGEARIRILNEYAFHVASRPVLGHGFNMSYILGPQLDKEAKKAGRSDGNLMRRHPHNGYMQIWFELGGFGALLFCAFGAALLWLAAAMPPKIQPFLFATFASIAAGIAPSYGLWQYWFFASICYTTLLIAIAAMAYTACGSETSGATE